jgi:hypothetical protein
VENIEMAKE